MYPLNKRTKSVPIIIICAGISLLFLLWLTLGRRTFLELKLDEGLLSLWENGKLLAEGENQQTNFSSLSLQVSHDKDSLGVLPFRDEVLIINSEKISLPRPKIIELLQEVKANFAFDRQPFAARILYNDTALNRQIEIPLTGKTINKISLQLWNATEIKLILKTQNEENISLWLRPKFHHDYTLTAFNKSIPFKAPIHDSSFYYLQIIISLLVRNLIATYFLGIIVFILSRLIPKNILQFPSPAPIVRRLLIFVICAVTFFTTYFIATSILQEIPHTQDEVAYLFQAKIFAKGKLFLGSAPGELRRFFDHEFIVNNGKWFGKYPPLTSLFLAAGVFIGKPSLINPIISTINIFLLIWLTKKFVSLAKATIVALLFTVSPFFLLISGSFFSHSTALLFTLLIILSLLNIQQNPNLKKHWVFWGISLGMLSLTRPANALGLIILSGFFLFRYIKCARNILLAGIILILFQSVNSYYNYILTGNPFRFPLSVYSIHDTLGFGMKGVEWGSLFTIKDGMKNLVFNSYSLLDVLFRWPTFLTLAFIPFAFFGKFRKQAVFLSAIFLIQVGVYFLYFHEGTFYGPRYWFEIAWILPLLTIIGIDTLISKTHHPKQSAYVAYSVLTILFIYGLTSTFSALPQFRGYNGMTPVYTPTSIQTPAVIFTPGSAVWQQYGRFFIKPKDPLNDPIIFARDQAIHNVPKNLPPIPNGVLKSLFPNRYFYLLKDNNYIQLW